MSDHIPVRYPNNNAKMLGGVSLAELVAAIVADEASMDAIVAAIVADADSVTAIEAAIIALP